MGFNVSVFEDQQLESDYIDWLVDEHSINIRRHFSKLWDYYTNRMVDRYQVASLSGHASGLEKCYFQAQEYGLPSRITGQVYSASGGVFCSQSAKDVRRKEVVIENDIGWRIRAEIDFLFGKPISFVSKSPDTRKRAEIESVLKAVFSVNGGIGFFQDMAVLGSVYGFVDCFVRPGSEITQIIGSSQSFSQEEVLNLAQTIDLELIEAPRALPVLDENDYKKIRCYIQHFYQKKNSTRNKGSLLSRLLSHRKQGLDSREVVAVTEIVSERFWQRYENKQLAAEGELPWGFLPVVHIQNVAQPFYYEGMGDVEPLIPLHDELNTRLSDRANRITFQSFKMYLGKGVEGFENRPVSPGMMWCTDNPEATIEEFGGDAAVPSEDNHIAEIREALDKASGVTPVVAGVLKSKVGNLTSAVALKMTLMGMLSKTDRKRFTYGEGLKRVCGMILKVLDKAGVYESRMRGLFYIISFFV